MFCAHKDGQGCFQSNDDTPVEGRFCYTSQQECLLVHPSLPSGDTVQKVCVAKQFGGHHVPPFMCQLFDPGTDGDTSEYIVQKETMSAKREDELIAKCTQMCNQLTAHKQ